MANRKKSTKQQTWVWPEACPFPPEDYDETTDDRLYPSRGWLAKAEECDVQNGPRPSGPTPNSPPPGKEAFALDTTTSRHADDLPYTLTTHDLDRNGYYTWTDQFLYYVSAGFNANRQEVHMRQYLSPAEVATLLDLDYATVCDMLRKRQLHGNQIRTAAHWRIPLLSLQRFLEGNGTYLPEQIAALMAGAERIIRKAADETDETDTPKSA